MKSAFYTLILLYCSLTLFNCSEEDEDTCFKCVYEERKSGCNNYSYGSWTEKEFYWDTEELKDGLSKKDACNLIKSEIECAGTCCVSYQVRNMEIAPCN